jgi:hypothetical protein
MEQMERRQPQRMPQKTPGVRVGYESVIPNPKARLLDQVREVMRPKHYSIHTERSYADWIRRYVRFHHWRSREELSGGEPKVEQFLSDLAVKGNVAASTQNQAFNALLFLYREVLHQPLEDIQAVRADRPVRVPVVLRVEEVKKVILAMSDMPQLVVKFLYGSGLRLMFSVPRSRFEANVMCASPAARVNGVNDTIPISYAIHVRYSPGLHRTCTGPAPAMHREDEGTHSQTDNVASL